MTFPIAFHIAPQALRAVRSAAAGGAAALLILAAAIPAGAQTPACPESPQELAGRCRTAEADAARLDREASDLERILGDPEVILVPADRLPGESGTAFRIRVERTPGLRSPVSDTWLPILGHYYLPDRDMAFVAMKRTDYWRYIGEALGFDTAEARRVFTAQERLGLDVRLNRFLGPQGRIARLRAESARFGAFFERCCEAGPGAARKPEPYRSAAPDPAPGTLPP